MSIWFFSCREEEIERNLAKMGKWRTELAAKIKKKEDAKKAAIEKKEKMVEEIRRRYGFSIDPNSAKFKELAAKKELEDKKAKKALKKEEKTAKLLEKISRQFNTTE